MKKIINFEDIEKIDITVEGKTFTVVDSTAAAKFVGYTRSSLQSMLSRGTIQLTVIKLHPTHNFYILKELQELKNGRAIKE